MKTKEREKVIKIGKRLKENETGNNSIIKNGITIAVEGLDGSGKTTICNALAKTEKVKLLHTSIPKLLPDIRRIMNDNLKKYVPFRFMYYLCAQQMPQEHISNYLKEGNDVIFDRYIYSTLATHLALDKLYNNNKNSEQIKILFYEAEKNFMTPDLVIFLNIDRVMRLKRIEGRQNSNDDTNETLMDLYLVEFNKILTILKEKGKMVAEVNNSDISIDKTLENIKRIIKKTKEMKRDCLYIQKTCKKV